MDRQLKYDRTTTIIRPEILTVKTSDLAPFKFTLTDEDIKAYKEDYEDVIKDLLRV